MKPARPLPKHLPTPTRQQGVVLVLSLVLLLLTTIIGVSAMQGTSMQERMAGNRWDRNLAFQAAEAGLRTGEHWLDAPGQAANIGVSRRAAAENYTALSNPTSWRGANPSPATSDAETEYATLSQLAQNVNLAGDTSPVFHVDPPSYVRLPEEINLNQSELDCDRYYPVTSYSVGGSASTVVILRTQYAPRKGGLVTCPNP